MPEVSSLRDRALAHAVASHQGGDAETIIEAAHKFHAFLANGDAPQAANAATPTKAPGRPRTPPPAVAAAAAAPPAAAATRPAKAAPAASGKAAAPAAGIPAPTTIAEAAASLKALAQSKEPGRGREVAVALLAEYGVTQLSQIPPAKLAEFKHRMDTAGSEAAGQAAAEPGDDLLG